MVEDSLNNLPNEDDIDLFDELESDLEELPEIESETTQEVDLEEVDLDEELNSLNLPTSEDIETLEYEEYLDDELEEDNEVLIQTSPEECLESIVKNYIKCYDILSLHLKKGVSNESLHNKVVSNELEELGKRIMSKNVHSCFLNAITGFVTSSSNIEQDLSNIDSTIKNFNLLNYDNNLGTKISNIIKARNEGVFAYQLNRIQNIINSGEKVVNLCDLFYFEKDYDVEKINNAAHFNVVQNIKDTIIKLKRINGNTLIDNTKDSKINKKLLINIGEFIDAYSNVLTDDRKIKDNLELTYIKCIIDFNSRSYVCGDCENISRFDLPFCSFISLSELNKVISVGGISKCPKCGKINLMPSSFYKNVEDLLQRTKSNYLVEKDKDRGIYISSIEEERCKDYIVDIDESNSEKEDEASSNIFDTKAILKDILVYEKRIDNLNLSGCSVISDKIKDAKKSNIIGSSVLALLLCGATGEDYSTLKKNSINSFIDFICSNKSLESILSINNKARRNAIRRSLKLVNSKDVNDMCLKKLRDEICPVVSDNNDIVGQINKYANEFIKTSEYYDKREDNLINTLINNYSLFGFISITNSCYLDEVGDKLLINDKVNNFVDKVSDEMILSYLCRKLYVMYKDFDSKLGRYIYNCSQKNNKISSAINVFKEDPEMGKFLKDLRIDFDLSIYANEEIQSHISNLERCLSKRSAYEVVVSLYKFYELLSMERFDNLRKSFYFKGFYSKLEENIPVFKKLVRVYGKDDKDIAYYYYGKLFTMEEIESSSVNLYNIHIPKFQLRKEEGETFDNYYNRIIEFEKAFNDKSNVDLNEVVVIDDKVKDDVIFDILPYIYPLFCFLNLLTVNNLIEFLSFRLLLNYLSKLSVDKIVSLFSIINSNKILNKDYFTIHKPQDSDKIILKEELKNMIYSDPDVNDALDEADGDFFEFISKINYPEDLMSAIEYCGEDFCNKVKVIL